MANDVPLIAEVAKRIIVKDCTIKLETHALEELREY